MRVIDSQRDYYDFSGLGIDETITFDRQGQESKYFPDENLGIPDVLRMDSYRNDIRTVWVEPFYAIVGGMGYPGISIARTDREGNVILRENFYDHASVEEIVAGLNKKEFFNIYGARISADDRRRFFDRGVQDLTIFCAENQVVTGRIFRCHRRSRYISDGDAGIEFRPDLLRDLGFDACLPAHEAHMLVSRFVGGIMSSNPGVDEITDKSKILKAGFDLKQSFRKRKAG